MRTAQTFGTMRRKTPATSAELIAVATPTHRRMFVKPGFFFFFFSFSQGRISTKKLDRERRGAEYIVDMPTLQV